MRQVSVSPYYWLVSRFKFELLNFKRQLRTSVFRKTKGYLTLAKWSLKFSGRWWKRALKPIST